MSTDSPLRPQDAAQVEEAVAWALASQTPLKIIGTGSKQDLGRPVDAEICLDLSTMAGISLYEPEELVLSAGPATPMAEIERQLDDRHQQLAFEPPDFGPLLGQPAGLGSLAGAVACNLSGSRRIKAGAARDHVLGVHAVSGRGEIFKTGGRVVKNVTGYDLSKLMTGSYGTLAVMTELTLKVLPAPEKTYTVLIYGLDDTTAAAAMSQAMGSSHDVSAAAHLPAPQSGLSSVDHVRSAGLAVTALRLEGVGPSVTARCQALRAALAVFGGTEELHTSRSLTFWREIRDVVTFHPASDQPLWRISTAPQAGPAVAANILGQLDGQAYYDWAGGLVWLAVSPSTANAGHGIVRAALGSPGGPGGHATLIRASHALRTQVPVFEPLPEPVMQLTRRIKTGFDPKGILNPGRLYVGM
ncbi:MAG: glycolate oxidase subunit GlcE [Alphaproteobacteria bacterium]